MNMCTRLHPHFFSHIYTHIFCQASDDGKSWRLTALAYVWVIAASATSAVVLLFAIYSAITFPPWFWHFAQTTLAVLVRISAWYL